MAHAHLKHVTHLSHTLCCPVQSHLEMTAKVCHVHRQCIMCLFQRSELARPWNRTMNRQTTDSWWRLDKKQRNVKYNHFKYNKKLFQANKHINNLTPQGNQKEDLRLKRKKGCFVRPRKNVFWLWQNKANSSTSNLTLPARTAKVRRNSCQSVG